MSTATDTKRGGANTNAGNKPSGGRGKRLTRQEKGLPDLTPTQQIARQQVQSAQNACKFIKDHIDQGNMVSGEVLSACSVLTGALAKMIGSKPE